MADFLNGHPVPLPTVTDERKAEMIKTENGSIQILKYYHFSIAINKIRRFQMWSALNVDYSPAKRDKRSRKDFGNDDKSWRYDSRIGREYQISDMQFYKPATKVDRGHMIMREDNCWGDTPLEIEYANADTFHWTNCTPQHQAFNQSNLNGLWGRLENHIKQNLNMVNNKACIFTGPVLNNSNDPKVNFGLGDVQYPVKFWKVLITVDQHEGLMAYGFVLDQSDVIAKFGLLRIDFAKFKIHQKTLRSITQMTGVSFPETLYKADVLKGNSAVTGLKSLQIFTEQDIQLHPYKNRGLAV